ncbi:MAG: hypothetical protein KBD19_03070 [Candidatus Moranbacteria bacterium]|nr:hypothetical protein [Candidatus Moranbacteria bacterium]
MSTTYRTYAATIPQVFFEDPGVKHLLALMNMNNRGLAQVDEFGAHFEVEELDGGLSYEFECANDADGLIERLIADRKICLVDTGQEWNSGMGCYEQDSEFDRAILLDPVALADKIPTLVLREVLAKRLAE